MINYPDVRFDTTKDLNLYPLCLFYLICISTPDYIYKQSFFKGKPKIFLVQSCRGDSVQEIAKHETADVLEEEEDFCIVTALKDADILIAYATTDGLWFNLKPIIMFPLRK